MVGWQIDERVAVTKRGNQFQGLESAVLFREDIDRLSIAAVRRRDSWLVKRKHSGGDFYSGAANTWSPALIFQTWTEFSSQMEQRTTKSN